MALASTNQRAKGLLQKYCSETPQLTPTPAARHPSRKPIPRTSPDRLEQSAVSFPTVGLLSPTVPSIGPAISPTHAAAASEPDTVLYLAYGSNLSAETFLGNRGIRPISRVNVSAPTLRLTFDLPGMPYAEPCFANTAPRKIPKEPDLPDPRDPIKPPPVPTPPGPAPIDPPENGPKKWDKGLVGVVYEVTREDYQHIVATEGGGASYKEIVVPCFIIPPRMNIPERKPGDLIPKPFLAKTLCAPKIPDAPEDGGGDKPGDGDDPDPRKKWWWRFLRGPQRQEDYAQPSARYLKLLTDGARENELPEEYQAYLQSLQAYTITTKRQEVGKWVMMILSLPVLVFMRFVVSAFADERGRVPTWIGMVMAVWFSFVWGVYDYVLKPLFGDGERTEKEKEAMVKRRWMMKREWNRSDEKCWWDEKRCFLGDVERGDE